MRFSATFRASRRQPWLQVVKSAIATIAAWLVAGWLIPGPLPVFAAIAALLVVQPSLNQSISKAVERSVGVIAGVILATALSLAFGQDTWVVLVAVAAALGVAWLLRMTTATANQVAISALLVLALGAATPDYAFDRIIETVIGAGIGFLVNLAFVPPVALVPAQQAIDVLGEEVASSLDRLAGSLAAPQSAAQLEELMLTARLMRPMVTTADAAIVDAAESLTLNPRSRRHREDLRKLEATLARLAPIVTQVIGMTRAVYDRYDTGLVEEPDRAGDRRAAEPGGARRTPRDATHESRPRRSTHREPPRAHVAARDRGALIGPLDPRRIAPGRSAAHPRVARRTGRTRLAVVPRDVV